MLRLIIDAFHLKIRAVVSFCHNDSILDLPFTVGTSPIQNQHLKAISNGKIKETNPNDDATESTTAPLLKPSTSFAADETAEIIQSIPLRPFYSGRGNLTIFVLNKIFKFLQANSH